MHHGNEVSTSNTILLLVSKQPKQEIITLKDEHLLCLVPGSLFVSRGKLHKRGVKKEPVALFFFLEHTA